MPDLEQDLGMGGVDLVLDEPGGQRGGRSARRGGVGLGGVGLCGGLRGDGRGEERQPADRQHCSQSGDSGHGVQRLPPTRSIQAANATRNLARYSRVVSSTSRPSASNLSLARATRISGWGIA